LNADGGLQLGIDPLSAPPAVYLSTEAIKTPELPGIDTGVMPNANDGNVNPFTPHYPREQGLSDASFLEPIFMLFESAISSPLQYAGVKESTANKIAGWSVFAGSLVAGGMSSVRSLGAVEDIANAERAAAVAEESVIKKLPDQLHHFATNKNTAYTPQMESIAEQFGLDLKGSWNTEFLPHLGRHPNVYHDFVLEGMQNAAAGAGGSQTNFLELFNIYVKQPVIENPLLLRKAGW
jgi:hypothetical protein